MHATADGDQAGDGFRLIDRMCKRPDRVRLARGKKKRNEGMNMQEITGRRSCLLDNDAAEEGTVGVRF